MTGGPLPVHSQIAQSGASRTRKRRPASAAGEGKQLSLFPNYFEVGSITFECDLSSFEAVSIDTVFFALNHLQEADEAKFSETLSRAGLDESELRSMLSVFRSRHKTCLSRLILALGIKRRLDRLLEYHV